MKKFFVILAVLLLSSPVMAKTIAVQSLSDFSTDNPAPYMSVKILDDIVLDENVSFKNGYIVEGRIIDVTDPKRLKRDASFTFVPLNYTDADGKVTDIKGYYTARYTTKINKGQLAKMAALGVGSFFVKGLAIGYSAVEGAVKNEKDNRFKSSVTNVYEDSPLSYVEKGGEIVIQKDQGFFLNFKVKNEPDEKNLPNYEYTELAPDVQK